MCLRGTRGFAKAYAGLGAMALDTALGLISSIGVRELVTKYAEVLALCSGAFAVSGGGAATPGGPGAVPVWTKLAGADPAKPAEFFRALLGKDGGRLAVFYFTLSQADSEAPAILHRQRRARADGFTSGTGIRPRCGLSGTRCPGTGAGSSSANCLSMNPAGCAFPEDGRRGPIRPERMKKFSCGPSGWRLWCPVASLEEKRGAPLDEASAGLLARHFAEWRSLFPYFAKLPALDSAGFQALAAFSEAASDRPADERDIQVGEWHSLVKLIELGAQAGSLDAAAAAQAFTRVCTALAGPDPSTRALAVLREIAGGQGSVDEAVATRLLRLSGPRRANYDRVRELQAAPTYRRGPALCARPLQRGCFGRRGVCRGARSDGLLLVSEDPRLLSRHRFVPRSDPKTARCSTRRLVRTRSTSASYLTGGFMTLKRLRAGTAAAQTAP